MNTYGNVKALAVSGANLYAVGDFTAAGGGAITRLGVTRS